MISEKGITVYCASADEIAAEYKEVAGELGAKIAEAGYAVINGGGRMGLMAAVTDGALSAGGEAVGIIPGFMVEQGRNHPGLSRTIVTDDMAERKHKLAAMASAAVALPGGVGTFEELFETMTGKKLGFIDYPIIILNINHYYDNLIAMLKVAEAEGFSYGPRCWESAESVEEAMDIIKRNA